MRSKKALYNSMASMLLQVVSLICGFILPRMILSSFGSSYNGITSSISQFLAVVTLLRAGIGGATRASLYKSLAVNDNDQISSTIKATEIFMRKISLIFVAGVLIFAICYPFFVKEFDWLFSSSLVVIISLSTFIQYYFGITYQMLLQADQKSYVYSLLQIITTILNTLLAALLIKCNVGIHGVKLGSSVVFCITPVFLNIYVKKTYNLNPTSKPDFSSIKQRWDAFFHQVVSFIHSNTDIMILTFFSNMKEISVYTVYYLVANGLKHIILTISSGIEAAFGNMLAKGEKILLSKNLRLYETSMHILVTIIFSSALVLITPFIKIYTSGITDVNYERYLFGYLVLIGEMFYCCKNPYESIVNAAGHFKQTKKYAVWESLINIIFSLILVYKYGLIGVVTGTVLSIIFRTFIYAYYIGNIVGVKFIKTIKRFLVTFLNSGILVTLSSLFSLNNITLYKEWIIYAIIITLLSILTTIIINFIFYKNDILELYHKLKNTLTKKCG